MAIIVSKPEIRFEITFKISDEELFALDNLTKYGIDKFMDSFERNMGQIPDRLVLLSLLESISTEAVKLRQRLKNVKSEFTKDEYER